MLRTLAGFQEALDNLHAAGDLLLDLLRTCILQLVAKFFDGAREIHFLQQQRKCFGTHASLEGVRTILGDGIAVLFFGEESFAIEAGLARVNHEVLLVINDLLQIARRHVEHERQAARHAL